MRKSNLNIWSLCLFFLTTGVCFCLIGCEKHDVSREHFGYVEGTVIDSLTRMPIDSAWITPDTSMTPIYTDSSGHYRFVEFAGNRLYLYCGKNEYVTKESGVYEIKWKETTIIDFELVPLGK
jgi:hypothetical protein